MSTIQKLIEKFNSKPVRNDITLEEVERLAKYYGCIVKTGGNHQIRIADVKSGTIIPIPCHDKHVKEAYIKELHQLFDAIEARKG